MSILKASLSAIGRRLKRVLFFLLRPLEQYCKHQGVRSPKLAAIYYAIFSDRFHREQWAVQHGQQKYLQRLKHPGTGSALLRRNIHRLEKGLTMRPRRDVFALDYIAETVAAYAQLASRCPATVFSDELRWSHDVLKQYFEVVSNNPIIAEHSAAFNQLPSPESIAATFTPYIRQADAAPVISIDDFAQLAKYRRSVRWFLPKVVEREKIDLAIAVAAQSPSACNRQPFVFRIFDDPECVRKISSIPMGTAGYEHNIPVFIVIVGQLRNYFDERDRHLIYIDGSLAAMSFVFAAEVQGLSTCCINWPDIEDREQKMASLLRLEEDERPVMCLAVGYPDPEGLVAYSQKKSVDELRVYN